MGSTKKTGSGGRRTRKPTSADREGTPRGPEEQPKGVPLSDPQEFDFLDRREGRVWSHAEIERGVRDTSDAIEESDKYSGRRMWRVADGLLELYNGFPERARGQPTFTQFAVASIDKLTAQEVSEFLRARAAVRTADEAMLLGRKKIELGLKLCKILGIKTFDALRARDLPLPGGETCRFPARVKVLQAALALLTEKASAVNPPSRRLVSEAARSNEAFKLARQEDPDLASIRRAKFTAGEGDVLFESAPLNRVQRIALARFFLRLEGRQ